MIDQRLKVWRRRGLSKRLKISTPTIKGASKIEAAFSRQRQAALSSEVPALRRSLSPRLGRHSLARRQARRRAPGAAVLRRDRRALAKGGDEAGRWLAVG
jgi:phage terminase large subunit GpA-like protein